MYLWDHKITPVELFMMTLRNNLLMTLRHVCNLSILENYISLGSSQWNQKRKRKSTKRITEFSSFPSLEEVDAEERKHFKSFMEQLGANNIFEEYGTLSPLLVGLISSSVSFLENIYTAYSGSKKYVNLMELYGVLH